MTVSELYKSVAQLGFEDSLEDDDRFIFAVSRLMKFLHRIILLRGFWIKKWRQGRPLPAQIAGLFRNVDIGVSLFNVVVEVFHSGVFINRAFVVLLQLVLQTFVQ